MSATGHRPEDVQCGRCRVLNTLPAATCRWCGSPLELAPIARRESRGRLVLALSLVGVWIVAAIVVMIVVADSDGALPAAQSRGPASVTMQWHSLPSSGEWSTGAMRPEVTLRNTGGETGSVLVSFAIDGTEIWREDVAVGPGQSVQVQLPRIGPFETPAAADLNVGAQTERFHWVPPRAKVTSVTSFAWRSCDLVVMTTTLTNAAFVPAKPYDWEVTIRPASGDGAFVDRGTTTTVPPSSSATWTYEAKIPWGCEGRASFLSGSARSANADPLSIPEVAIGATP